MGNHFRTSGAGDDAPKTQAGVQGSRFATPDSEGQPVAQAPAQPADQAQPASDPFAYNPTSDVALSGTAVSIGVGAGVPVGAVVPSASGQEKVIREKRSIRQSSRVMCRMVMHLR